jgi:hypothetical protein
MDLSRAVQNSIFDETIMILDWIALDRRIWRALSSYGVGEHGLRSELQGSPVRGDDGSGMGYVKNLLPCCR